MEPPGLGNADLRSRGSSEAPPAAVDCIPVNVSSVPSARAASVKHWRAHETSPNGNLATRSLCSIRIRFSRGDARRWFNDDCASCIRSAQDPRLNKSNETTPPRCECLSIVGAATQATDRTASNLGLRQQHPGRVGLPVEICLAQSAPQNGSSTHLASECGPNKLSGTSWFVSDPLARGGVGTAGFVSVLALCQSHNHEHRLAR